MKKLKTYKFTATIYKTGINYAVDVPAEITSKLIAIKGYIKIKGTVNGFPFTKSLVPVKNGLYRLFVNVITLKGAKTWANETARFVIEQDDEILERDYPMPDLLTIQLKEKELLDTFNSLSNYRKKEILRYVNNIKTSETLQKNISRLIAQLEQKSKDVRVP